jgi:hypothetical protein
MHINITEFLEVDIMAIELLTSSSKAPAASKDLLNTDKEIDKINNSNHHL